MILLLDNAVDDATITSINESLNYPAENLQDQALKKRYQSVLTTDTITITFTSTESINCFFYGFTNATYMELRLYSNSAGLLYTLEIISTNEEADAYHFTTVQADYAEIDITGYDNPYLGGIGLGLSIEYPDPDNKWDEKFIDNSIFSESLDGQTVSEYIKPLRAYSWRFLDIDRDYTNYYQELYKAIGIGKPVWIDPFENDHTFMIPIYAKLTAPTDSSKEGRNYNFNLTITEAR